MCMCCPPNSARPTKRQSGARRKDAAHRLRPSLWVTKRENRRRAEARRRTLRVSRPRSRLRRTQTMLIRTRGVPMTAQCDAESKRASRVRSRSQRPEEQSMRPVHRPFRTKATDEASKPDCSFSNVAARTPAWQCAPDCGRTCRQRHASRSIVSILEVLAATVARRLQRRACDRHQGGRRCARVKTSGGTNRDTRASQGMGQCQDSNQRSERWSRRASVNFLSESALGRHSTVQPAKAPARSIALGVRPSGHPPLGGPPSVADIHQICTSASLREPATAPYALSSHPGALAA